MYLVVDRKLICSVPTTRDMPMALMSAFFVYDVHYPKGFGNVFQFLEGLLFGIKPKKQLAACVTHLMSVVSPAH